MANVLVNEQSLTDIAAAIRAKNGEETTYKPGEMAAAISNLPAGGGSLKYVQLTLTYKSYRVYTCDITDYINKGTVYFVFSHGSSNTKQFYTAIINAGVLEGVYASRNTDGTLFYSKQSTTATNPAVSITDGIITVSYTSSDLGLKPNLIYIE